MDGSNFMLGFYYECEFFERILVILELIERVKQKRHLTSVADINVRLRGWENLGLLRGGSFRSFTRNTGYLQEYMACIRL